MVAERSEPKRSLSINSPSVYFILCGRSLVSMKVRISQLPFGESENPLLGRQNTTLSEADPVASNWVRTQNKQWRS